MYFCIASTVLAYLYVYMYSFHFIKCVHTHVHVVLKYELCEVHTYNVIYLPMLTCSVRATMLPQWFVLLNISSLVECPIP